MPILARNVLFISSIFLRRFLVVPILLLSCTVHCSFKKVFLSILAILWNSAFSWLYLSLSPLPYASLLFSAICKISLDNHFSFLHFFFFGIVLVITSCTILQTSIHSSSGTLPSRPNLIGHHVHSVQSYQACSKREMRRNISYTEIWYKKKKKLWKMHMGEKCIKYLICFCNRTFWVTSIRVYLQIFSKHFLFQTPIPRCISMCKSILDPTMQECRATSKSGEPCVRREAGGVGRQRSR